MILDEIKNTDRRVTLQDKPSSVTRDEGRNITFDDNVNFVPALRQKSSKNVVIPTSESLDVGHYCVISIK